MSYQVDLRDGTKKIFRIYERFGHIYVSLRGLFCWITGDFVKPTIRPDWKIRDQ